MKKNFLIFSTIAAFLVISFTQIGCSEDDGGTTVTCTTETYDADIKGIVNTYCAYSGCHVSGFASGDFSTYAGMKSRLDNGQVEARAITQMNMPPSGASGPTSLSAADFDKLKCWLENGHPEN